ncbi:MAG: helix-turn-helix domain-containing protein [Bacilli bacterium]|nr:helix-turn-helix domain-containing protein [Bacilli bacterium]
MGKELGRKVKALRKSRGMNQQQFAESLGYKQKSMISKIESGEAEMSYEKLLVLIREYMLNASEYLDIAPGEIERIDQQIKEISAPDPNRVFPIRDFEGLVNVKPTVRNPNIIVGDFTYYSGNNFEAQVTHHYDFIGDKLIIGKFCQIGKGVEFVMNGANHQMNAASTFPFYVFRGWEMDPPKQEDLPLKGDTVIGNDVWIGEGATILPGVHIGDGAIIGKNAVVGSDVPAYHVVVGNPAKVIRARFDEEMIGLLERLKWWDLPVEEVQTLIPTLTDSNLDRAKERIKEILKTKRT